MLEADEIGTAIDHHRRGEAAAALAIYTRILDATPDHAQALHYCGLLACEHGEQGRGISMISRALELEPDDPDARNNLGNVLMIEGRLDEAEAHYRRAVKIDPLAIPPLINLGVLARARQADDEAHDWYRRAIGVDPRHPGAWTNLSGLLFRQGRQLEALDALQNALGVLELVDAGNVHLHRRRARILSMLERFDEAGDIHAAILRVFPDDEDARHMCASLSGNEAPARPSEAYVRELFDRFASSFDEVLDNLDYKAPELIGEHLTRNRQESPSNLRVLDVGCGTGLCGVLMRPLARELTGIDLSSGMLQRAASTGHYDLLVEAEIVSYLRQAAAKWDLIVSADTLCYFGALNEVLAAAAAALATPGELVFTVERTDADPADGYLLNPFGRYCHSREYLVSQLAICGLHEPVIEPVVLRRQAAHDVQGYLVSARH